MRRFVSQYLQAWLTSRLRKPMVMRGARQAGKTWLVRHLAKAAGKQLIEINFEKNPELYSAFSSNEPPIILRSIELTLAIKINVAHSILFLDEIQSHPDLLAKLRWFYELLPELPIIVAGSLLDFALDDHEFSMPVGRITYVHVEPLSFIEFLWAKKLDDLVSFLSEWQLNSEIPSVVHVKLINLFREFLAIGGMPAAVFAWCETYSLHEVALAHSDLLLNYRDDFSKYAGKISTSHLEDVMSAVPRMLGQKFIYSHVNGDVNGLALKNALNLLCKARVCFKVRVTAANGLPLLAEVNNKRFKVGLLDIGLVSALLNLRLNQFESTDDLNLINQGAISEQVVGQLLRTIDPPYVEANNFYWCREERNASAEVDYVIQHAQHVIPIEVKSGKTGSMKSLQLFMQLKKRKLAVRINSDTPSLVDVNMRGRGGENIKYQLFSIPFYLINELHRLLDANLKIMLM